MQRHFLNRVFRVDKLDDRRVHFFRPLPILSDDGGNFLGEDLFDTIDILFFLGH